MRRRTTTLALAVGLVLGAPGAAVASEDPLREAREAAARLRFTAVVTVRWVDAIGGHEVTLRMQGDGGRIVVDGPRELVADAGGGLALQPPPANRKYDLRVAPGADYAGRPATSVEVWARGELRERLTIDEATGLVLRREYVDAAGRPVRVMAVDELHVTGVLPSPPADRRPSPAAGVAMGVDLPRLFRAPARLDAGYVQVAAYRQGSVVHVVYSDGLHGLSLFGQPGRLDAASLPGGGRRVQLGERPAWAYILPGGEAVMWQDGPFVYTLVGDGPLADVLAAATSLPRPPSLSVAGRLKQSARAMAELVAGRR